MKTIKYFTLLLFASTTLLAQTEKRSVSPFDGIHVAGHYDVTLTQGSEGTITLSGNQDDLDKIETYIKKGELIIKQKKLLGLRTGILEKSVLISLLKT